MKPFGWSCQQAADAAGARVALAEAPAIVLVDQCIDGAAALMAEVRQMPAPVNGTPILTVGGEARGAVGSGGQLGLPVDREALLALLRQWAGPLEDHAARAEPWHFRYRLLRLLGLDNTDVMLARLRANLREAVDQAEAEGTATSAHRLAGLAGICGFAEVSQAWSRVDQNEVGALAGALDVSRRAIADLDAVLGDPGGTT
ncbi:Hpt domain-containing protein [Novosphingobium sp. JCM 18896]|uniref:Hpt domain-containing protein n=1 Tax=Novosphingobium sp. JCM 18896 TaxID=2989731 RepID=UPI00222219F1|nr:Hpt domain-containing protein [Novosphingobium sp. JCM 18896]MCW1427478.1 Hpt domain-containing protein [Novosphingobium sp. JCM 18896]